MQRYRCPKCGAYSYSSAGTSSVGACPTCLEPLAGIKAEAPGAAKPEYRGLDMSAAKAKTKAAR